MVDIPSFVLQNLIKAWGRHDITTRIAILFSVAAQFSGLAFAIYTAVKQLPKETSYAGWLLFGIGLFASLLVAAREQLSANEAVAEELRAAAEKARENPARPEFAWDLARSKLERYLDRNLYEVRAIFLLTTLVMLAGFALIVYGLLQAFASPAALDVSIVSAASGVLLSFIGGSFMLIYRSVLSQSASYVSILERINAVGMAVQIASTVPESNGKLKAETTAELARTLLLMYSKDPKNEKTPGAG